MKKSLRCATVCFEMNKINPDLDIKQLTKIFQKVKRNTIIALRLKGLSYREIERRLGGTTSPIISKILEESGLKKKTVSGEKNV